ncbi:DNA polymerase zeta [Coemansia sp. RSA 1085]|nr:DNA polymerase zeta [Coemansia sp. RSA 1085]
MLVEFAQWVRRIDPDILCGYEVQKGSWGFIIERAELAYGLQLSCSLSRLLHSQQPKNKASVDSWSYRKGAAIKIAGRHVLNIWRLLRSELNLTSYMFENTAAMVLGERSPRYAFAELARWYQHGPVVAHIRVLRYVHYRAIAAIRILHKTDIVARTSEFARVIGIDFNSVITRGSQLRVESLMARVAHPEQFILASPTRQQVSQQRAAECLPLVLEPQSNYYTDPVVVLDFQSLYPSIIIAYNYCFSTCLGSLEDTAANSRSGVERRLGFTSLNVPPGLLSALKDHITISPNGVMFVKPAVRKGLLGRMLQEILDSRVMIKEAMKLWGGDDGLYKMLDSWQLGLKLIANVTYGYAGASFSGRMPCVEIADAIVQSGRETLESAIRLIHSRHADWGGKVIYGDTDSVFVWLPGRSRQQAFRIGREIAAAVTEQNPEPVKLKLEKVYQPCVLLTKKRYAGWMYETDDQAEPLLDVKGMELVRRDGCTATQRILEGAMSTLFETNDLSLLKAFLTRQFSDILSSKVPIDEFIIAKEVRMHSYSGRMLPAHAKVAANGMELDPQAEPEYGERVPYVVVHNGSHTRLVDRVVSPHTLLAQPQLQLDFQYYIDKQILPALDRLLSLVGVDVQLWFSKMSRRSRTNPAALLAQAGAMGRDLGVQLKNVLDKCAAWSRCTHNVKEMELRQTLLGHDGCVNALCWSSDGRYLFSGSDDATICIWRAAGDGSLICRFHTGFSERVFDLKAMLAPNQNVLVACSMDTTIKLFDVSRLLSLKNSALIAGNTTRPLADFTIDGTACCIRTITSHGGPVKRAALIPDAPFELLSCSEDGTVRHFDIRENVFPESQRVREGRVVADYRNIGAEIHALDVNVFHPTVFAAGGSMTSIVVHDRRMPGFEALSWGKQHRHRIERQGNECFVRLRRDKSAAGDSETLSDETVTGLRFSRDEPNLVIGSWCYDYIYLFDLNRSDTYSTALDLAASGSMGAGGDNDDIYNRCDHRRVADYDEAILTSTERTLVAESLNMLRTSLDACDLTSALASVSFALRSLADDAATDTEITPSFLAIDSISSDLRPVLLAMYTNAGFSRRRIQSSLYNSRACIHAIIFRKQWDELFTQHLLQADIASYDIARQQAIARDFVNIKSLLDSAIRDFYTALHLNQFNILAHYNRLLVMWDSIRLDLLQFMLGLFPLLDGPDASVVSDPEKMRLQAEFGSMACRVREIRAKIYEGWMAIRIEAKSIRNLQSLLLMDNEESGSDDIPSLLHANEAFFEVCAYYADILARDSAAVLEPYESYSHLFGADAHIDSTSCETVLYNMFQQWRALSLPVSNVDMESTTSSYVFNDSLFGATLESLHCPTGSSSEQHYESDGNRSIKDADDHHVSPPVVLPCRRYRGHCNLQTIKDVNFVFDKYVASGSDDGHFFLWNRQTMDIVQILRGDNEVVNIIESHPALPIIAVSGIDSEVQIFHLSQGGPAPAHQRNFPVTQHEHIFYAGLRDPVSCKAFLDSTYSEDPYSDALVYAGHSLVPRGFKHIAPTSQLPYPAVSKSMLARSSEITARNEEMRASSLASSTLTHQLLSSFLFVGRPEFEESEPEDFFNFAEEYGFDDTSTDDYSMDLYDSESGSNESYDP